LAIVGYGDLDWTYKMAGNIHTDFQLLIKKNKEKQNTKTNMPKKYQSDKN
jgi:hypothetical protein